MSSSQYGHAVRARSHAGPPAGGHAGAMPVRPHRETHRSDRIGWLRAGVLGAQDGVVGAKTRAALRLWQKARRLPADGYLSLDMIARLRADTGR